MTDGYTIALAIGIGTAACLLVVRAILEWADDDDSLGGAA